MNIVAKSIGYTLIIVGLVVIIFALFMWNSLPVNPIAVLLAIPMLIVGLILLGIGAIAAKK